jgi:hypothetical protein
VPARSARIAGAAVCAIVESSRSITDAAMTTMKPSQTLVCTTDGCGRWDAVSSVTAESAV